MGDKIKTEYENTSYLFETPGKEKVLFWVQMKKKGLYLKGQFNMLFVNQPFQTDIIGFFFYFFYVK